MPNDDNVHEVDQGTSRELGVIVLPNELAIYATQETINIFSKRNQLQEDITRRFQRAAGVPSDITVTCSASASGIKNNPIARRNALTRVDIMGHSKHAAQEKTSYAQSDAVSATMKQIAITRNIRQF